MDTRNYVTQGIIELKRFRNTNRGCMCCSRRLPEAKRMYALNIGKVTDERTGSTMTYEHLLCEDCRELVGTKFWYYDKDIAESHIYKKMDIEEIPHCCGDCKETKCKLPYDAYGIEVIDPYMFDERHPKCPLRRI